MKDKHMKASAQQRTIAEQKASRLEQRAHILWSLSLKIKEMEVITPQEKAELHNAMKRINNEALNIRIEHDLIV